MYQFASANHCGEEREQKQTVSWPDRLGYKKPQYGKTHGKQLLESLIQQLDVQPSLSPDRVIRAEIRNRHSERAGTGGEG